MSHTMVERTSEAYMSQMVRQTPWLVQRLFPQVSEALKASPLDRYHFRYARAVALECTYSVVGVHQRAKGQRITTQVV